MGYPPLETLRFEPAWGATPSHDDVIAEHPTLPHLILRVKDPRMNVNCDAIYDRTDGKIVWAPEHGKALMWTDEGRTLLLIGAASDEDVPILERYAWPDRIKAAESLELPCSGDVLGAATLSPKGSYCGFEWIVAPDSGFDIVLLGKAEARLEYSDFVESYSSCPVFSPDERLVVILDMEGSYWWSPDPDQNLPSDGGLKVMAELLITLVGSWEWIVAPVEVRVPEGWQPEPNHEFCYYFLADMPRFVDDRTLRLRLPTGERRLIDVEATRTDPRWVHAREAKKRAAEEEKLVVEARREAIRRHNLKAGERIEVWKREGVTCPYCHKSGRDFKHTAGSPEDRAVVLCGSCGRSVPLDQ